jgi:phosphohistidine phosphatase
MEAIARGMQELRVSFDRILTSPLVRARETAEIVARAYDVEDQLVEEERLASGSHFGDFQAVLKPFPPGAKILLVGHEPDLSGAVETLIGGGQVRMRKASLACVDCHSPQPGAGILRWLLDPDQLERAGR